MADEAAWQERQRRSSSTGYSVGEIYFLVVPTLFFVLAAFGVTPDVPLVGSFDLREYYWSSRKAIFLPYAAYAVLAHLADVVIVGQEAVASVAAIDLVRLVLVIFIVSALLFTKRVWIHAVVLGLLFSGLINYFFVQAVLIDTAFVQ